jgi:hypothetical protein
MLGIIGIKIIIRRTSFNTKYWCDTTDMAKNGSCV